LRPVDSEKANVSFILASRFPLTALDHAWGQLS